MLELLNIRLWSVSYYSGSNNNNNNNNDSSSIIMITFLSLDITTSTCNVLYKKIYLYISTYKYL